MKQITSEQYYLKKGHLVQPNQISWEDFSAVSGGHGGSTCVKVVSMHSKCLTAPQDLPQDL